MSYFGTALKALMERKSLTAADLERVTQIDDSLISRFRSGDKRPAPDVLAKLVPGVSSDQHEQAELVRAWVLDDVDECTAPGAELVKDELMKIVISAGRKTGREAAPSYLVKLTEEAEANFAAIREWYIKDRNVQSIVDGVGGVLRTGDVRSLKEGSSSTPPGKFPGTDVKVPPGRFGPQKKNPPQK